MHEWSLLFFTLLIQFAVGSLISFELIHWTGDFYGNATSEFLFKKEFIIIAAAIIIGGIFSVTHLGSPLKAINSLNNIKTSWLSREILMVGLFSVTFFTHLFLLSTGKKSILLSIVSCILGILLIFTMTKIYMLPTAKNWNSTSTIVSFFGSTFLLGFVFNYIQTLNKTTTFDKQIYFLIFISVVILLNHIYYSFFLVNNPPNNSLVYARIVLLLAVVVISLSRLNVIKDLNSTNLIHILLIISVLASEVIGRYIFYSTYESVGL